MARQLYNFLHMNKDYYQILGIDQTANTKKIKRAYRKLALKHHPDKNPGDAHSADRFKTILEAYQVLSDTSARREYDLHYQTQAGFDYDSFTDYAQRRPHSHRSAGKPQARAEDKTVGGFSRSKFILHELSQYLKTQKPPRPDSPVPKQRVDCSRCGGRGLKWFIISCRTCNGIGYYYRVQHKEYEVCPACQGHGWGEMLFTECLCDYCQGQGVVKRIAPRPERCLHCDGFGFTLKDSWWRKLFSYPQHPFFCWREVCYICEGHGYAPHLPDIPPQQRCAKCKGYGWVGIDILRRKATCRRCKGSGRKKE